MTIYRLTGGDYCRDLSGNGAALYGGRWNSPGLNALYCTENISLAILEILVNVNKYNVPKDYHLLTLQLPESISPVVISHSKLKKNWKDDFSYTRFMGDEFLKSRESLLLKIPSVIVEAENNFIINPKHPGISKVKIISSKLFEFDKRLHLFNE